MTSKQNASFLSLCIFYLNKTASRFLFLPCWISLGSCSKGGNLLSPMNEYRLINAASKEVLSHFIYSHCLAYAKLSMLLYGTDELFAYLCPREKGKLQLQNWIRGSHTVGWTASISQNITNDLMSTCLWAIYLFLEKSWFIRWVSWLTTFSCIQCFSLTHSFPFLLINTHPLEVQGKLRYLWLFWLC